MMTSTFPSYRSDQSLKNGLKEIQSKKEALMALETALKKRVSEFRELCLKEGELTGQLPVDYPLQPREPIPQIRRRIKHSISSSSSSSNGNNDNLHHYHHHDHHHPPNNVAPPCPVRTRHLQKPDMVQSHSAMPTAMLAPMNVNIPFPSRPTSTNSTSSSLSTASSNTRSTGLSSSTATTHNSIQANPSSFAPPPSSSNHHNHTTGSFNSNNNNNNNNNNGHCFNNIPYTISTQKPQQQQHFNMDGVVKFQPYYEETKPFQMSDFYKYSSKHRQRLDNEPLPPPRCKTTKQLQDDVLRKNSLKFSSCDDQIQASVKLIERSGQKLIEATAKAIASNPGLAEKLNSILPGNGDRY